MCVGMMKERSEERTGAETLELDLGNKIYHRTTLSNTSLCLLLPFGQF